MVDLEFGLKQSRRIQVVYERIKSSGSSETSKKTTGKANNLRKLRSVNSRSTSHEATLAEDEARQSTEEESTDSFGNDTPQSTGNESTDSLEESTPNYYCMTEQCKADIKNEFEKSTYEQPDPQNIVGILKKIFEEPFRNALEGNDKSLIGKTVHLPKIFPHEMNYSNKRFKFRDFSLSLVITEDLLRLIERFKRGIEEPLLIEGPSGIGKSFILYFLVCYLLASEDHWFGYIALPSKYKRVDATEITEFSQFYYSDIIKHFPTFDFEIGFGDNPIDSLDYPPKIKRNVGSVAKNESDKNTENNETEAKKEKKRQYFLIIDQFNNFLSTYDTNKTFVNSILEPNQFPRLIISGSANNDLDWEIKIPKFYNHRKAFPCDPRPAKEVAAIMLRNLFIEQNINVSSANESYLNYLIEQSLAVTSGVPLELRRLAEDLSSDIKQLLESFICDNPPSFKNFCMQLNVLLSYFGKKQYLEIQRSLVQFSESSWILKNAIFQAQFNASNMAIIYGTTLDNLNPLSFDKRFFYESEIVGKKSKILPLYDQARLVMWKLYMPEALGELESIINRFTSFDVQDHSVFGKLLEIYYWNFARLTKKIRLTPECEIVLDEVVLFDIVPEFNFGSNTLFVPMQSNYPMYDFVLVVGRGSKVRVIFIQFTIQNKYSTKLAEISMEYDAFCVNPTRMALNPIDAWLSVCANLRNRKIEFYELFLHYYKSKSGGDFNMCSFGDQKTEITDCPIAFNHLRNFMQRNVQTKSTAELNKPSSDDQNLPGRATRGSSRRLPATGTRAKRNKINPTPKRKGTAPK